MMYFTSPLFLLVIVAPAAAITWTASCEAGASVYMNVSSGEKESCPGTQVCACFNYFPDEDTLLHCAESEEACRDYRESPTMSSEYDSAFVSVQSSIVHTFGGGVSIWNTTGFWANDAKSAQARLDTASNLRSLSSGSYFKFFNHAMLNVAGTTYDVNTDGCVINGTNDGYAVAGLPSAHVCVGSIKRWTAPDATDTWTVHDDVFIGLEDGVAVWGWNEWGGAGVYEVADHRAYVDNTTKFLLRETQTEQAMSYWTKAEATLSAPEDVYGSFIPLTSQPSSGLFDVPSACTNEKNSLLSS